MDYYCLIQVRLEGRDIPVDIGYSQGTSVQAVLERACRTLGIYDSWNHALYSELFKTWLCESHLLSSYPAEDTLIVRKKTPEYLEIVYNEENPKKRSVSSLTNTSVHTKRRGVFSSTKTCLKTRFQSETIYFSAILFTSDNKILITSGTKMFPTVEVIKDGKIFGNFEDDSEEFAHVIRTSLDWATSTEFDHKDDDSDSLHSSHSNGTTSDSSDNNYSQYYGDQDTQWARSFGQAALKLKNELSLELLGTLYEHVVQMNTLKSKFIVALQHVPNCIKDEIAHDLIKSGTLKWKNFDEISSIYQKDPHPIWSNFIEKWSSRQTKLSPGLYLGVLYTESTLQGIKILVPKDRKQFIPLGKVRDEATITPEEASWIKSLTCLSQDCFMDLVMATRSDHDNNKSALGQFQASFLDCYHKLQLDTNLNWESGDIYGDQTVDIYLDLQTNQMYTMMGELDDNIIEQSSQNDLYLDPNVPNNSNNNNNNNYNNNKFKNIYKSNSNNNSNSKLQQQQDDDYEKKEKKGESQKSQKDKEFEKKEGIAVYEPQDSTQDSEDEQEVNYVIDADDDDDDDDDMEIDHQIEKNEELNKRKGLGFKMSLSALESEFDEDEGEGGSMVKTCTSTGAATSVAGEITSQLASSLSSCHVGNTNTIRPFIRIILIVKPMRQPHQIRGPYFSRLCMLYPFPLYDALQHATFNTSLYACSRRAMQILQASRAYFTQEFVKRLQKVDNFSEINEQNLEDFFFDPDEFNKVPDDARKIQQALDVIRDEIVTLRQQWNASSWTMTAIEWDRQRMMQAYSFGGRSMTLNVSKSAQSRAASVYNLSLSNNDEDSNVNRKRLSSTSRISSDTVSQIEILRDVMFHAPDRAWDHIRFLGIPIPSLSSTNNNNEAINNTSNHNGKDKKKKQNDKQHAKTSQSQPKVIPQILATYLASSPVMIPTLNRSSSVSSTVSTISSNASSPGGINPFPARKRSAGHRLMRTLGFGGSRINNAQQQHQSGEPSDFLNTVNNNQSRGGTENNKKFLAKRTNPKKIKEIDENSIINFVDDDTITIMIPSPSSVQPMITSSQQLIPSFTLEPTDESIEIQFNNDQLREEELLLNSEQKDVKKNDSVSTEINKNNNNVEKGGLNKIDSVENNDEYAVVSKNVKENENEFVLQSETIESKLVDSEFQTLIDIIESKSKSQLESEASIMPHIDEKNVNVNKAEIINTVNIKNIAADDIKINAEKKDEIENKDKTVKVNENVNNEENMENDDETDNTADAIIDENVDSLNVSNKLLTAVSEDSMHNLLATSNSTSTCTSTTHTTTTSATDTPLSSRASSSPSTPHPHPPPSTPTNGLILNQSSISNVSFPSVPSTPHFPPPLFSQSIPPTPSTPYFPAEFSLLYSPETSRPETPEFPHDLSNELSAPPTPQLVPQTYTDGPQAPLSSPSTPQFSPSAENSRPSTPQLNSPTLFEELKQATNTLYEELINISSPILNSKPPTPQVSPPISPSLLPLLPSTPRSIPSTSPITSQFPGSTEKFPTSLTASSNYLFRATTPPPLVNLNSISRLSTSPTSKQIVISSTTNSPTSPSASPLLPTRPPLTRSISERSSRPSRSAPSSISSSTRPPPLPLPPTWPILKSTKKPEPKKEELEQEADQPTFQRKTRPRTTSLSEGSGYANKHLQIASDNSDHSLTEYSNTRINLEQQKITSGEGLKNINNSKVKATIGRSFKNYLRSPTKNKEFFMDVKSTPTNDVSAELTAKEKVIKDVNSLVNGVANNQNNSIANDGGDTKFDSDVFRFFQF